MSRARDRVLNLEEVAFKINLAKTNGKSVALCHGCFDILHIGHLRHFESAREGSDVLVVTVTPDEYVGKGPGRPVFPAIERAELIAGVGVVDWVAVNHWPSATETILLLQPNFFVKGEEYAIAGEGLNPNFLQERLTVESIGGKILFTRDEVRSSSDAVHRIQGKR